MLPSDLPVSQFYMEIRKHIPSLDPKQTLFLFVNEHIPPNEALISEIYTRHCDPDGFLYITYSGENTFGGELELSF
uniref:Autophagy-related protein n=1 Tax=Arcella intermedia TaxID=1963864 RepID=A0A6B2LSJ3_9EUKA